MSMGSAKGASVSGLTGGGPTHFKSPQKARQNVLDMARVQARQHLVNRLVTRFITQDLITESMVRDAKYMNGTQTPLQKAQSAVNQVLKEKEFQGKLFKAVNLANRKTLRTPGTKCVVIYKEGVKPPVGYKLIPYHLTDRRAISILLYDNPVKRSFQYTEKLVGPHLLVSDKPVAQVEQPKPQKPVAKTMPRIDYKALSKAQQEFMDAQQTYVNKVLQFATDMQEAIREEEGEHPVESLAGATEVQPQPVQEESVSKVDEEEMRIIPVEESEIPTRHPHDTSHTHKHPAPKGYVRPSYEEMLGEDNEYHCDLCKKLGLGDVHFPRRADLGTHYAKTHGYFHRGTRPNWFEVHTNEEGQCLCPVKGCKTPNKPYKNLSAVGIHVSKGHKVPHPKMRYAEK